MNLKPVKNVIKSLKNVPSYLKKGLAKPISDASTSVTPEVVQKVSPELLKGQFVRKAIPELAKITAVSSTTAYTTTKIVNNQNSKCSTTA